MAENRMDKYKGYFSGVTPEDVSLILDWIDETDARNGLSWEAQKHLISYISCWAREFPLGAGTLQDIYTARRTLQATRKNNTMRQAIAALNRFYTWYVEDRDYQGVSLEKLRKVKQPPPDLNTHEPGDMLSPDEVNKFIKTFPQVRDRALFSMLYEGGFRPVELTRMKWSQIEFDNAGAVAQTSEKTGKGRYVRLVECRRLLAEWKDVQSRMIEITHNTPVFTAMIKPYQGITVPLIRYLTRIGAEKAQIPKDIYPYLFRHSKITQEIKDGWPESVIKLIHWGNLRTPMLATYVHLAGRDIDNVVLAKLGVQNLQQETESTAMKPQICPRCKSINPATATFCVCGQVLSEEAVSMLDWWKCLMNDPDLMIEYATRKKEKGVHQTNV